MRYPCSLSFAGPSRFPGAGTGKALPNCGGRHLNKFLFQRKAALPPSLKASLERPHAGDPPAAKQQRHTGAGGLVGSGTVEHDVAVAGDLLVALLELVGQHMESTGHFHGVRLELQRAA